ncbi:HDOD domain-containing protein [candidate division KSB1 bacterium]|nr:HDOD domain-containing protein [candidate division KSB1 bacterium]
MIANVIKKDDTQNTQNPKDKKLLAFLSKIENLPVLPPVAIKILDKTKDPEFSIDDLIDLIMMDQVLTAKMVRVVNSVYFGLGRRIESLREALVYLGSKEIKNVVLTTTLVNNFSNNQNSKLFKSFWEYSFATAVVSKLLAKSLKYKDHERAYLAGLLHDIGEVILIHNFPNEFLKVVKKVESTNMNFEEAENEILGISHTDFGPWLLEQWNYFGEIAHVVSRHHKPETSIYERHLVAIVHIAGLYCQNNNLGFGLNDDFKHELEMNFAWEILKNDISPNETFNISGHIAAIDDNLSGIKEIVNNIC